MLSSDICSITAFAIVVCESATNQANGASISWVGVNNQVEIGHFESEYSAWSAFLAC